jgi:hypothetical protein
MQYVSKHSLVKFLNALMGSDPTMGRQLCEPLLQSKAGAKKSFVDMIETMLSDDPQEIRPIYVRNLAGDFDIIRFELAAKSVPVPPVPTKSEANITPIKR